MTSDPFRTLVISDLHLGDPTEDGAVAEALVSFLEQHRANGPGAGMRWRLVVAGDLFDLESRRWRAGRRFDGRPAAIADALARDFAGVFGALRAFTEAGHRVVVCAGNHDAGILDPMVAARLRR